MFQPSLFLRFLLLLLLLFSQQTLPPLRERKALSPSTFWCLGNLLFPEKSLNGSLPSSGLTANATHACPILFQNWMTNSILWGLDYIQLRSQLVLKSRGLFFPKRLVFIPPSALAPFSFFLSFFNSAVLWRVWPHTESITGIKPGKEHTVMKY